MNWKPVALTVSLAATAATFGGFAPQRADQTPPVMKWEGKALPKIKMTSIAGRKITNRTLRGKVAIIDFWATWCPPCKAASPTMQKLQSKYGKRGFMVIGADVFEHLPPRADLTAPAKKYSKEHKYSYTFTFNNDALAQKLGLQGIPTFLIVDRRGKIAKVIIGFDDSVKTLIDKTVSKLL